MMRERQPHCSRPTLLKSLRTVAEVEFVCVQPGREIGGIGEEAGTLAG